MSIYVGKAQGLRSRIRTGHAIKEWTRCLVIQREGLHAFNASDISWLERRMIDVLLEAPMSTWSTRRLRHPSSCPSTRRTSLSEPWLRRSGFSGCSTLTSPDQRRLLRLPGACAPSTALSTGFWDCCAESAQVRSARHRAPRLRFSPCAIAVRWNGSETPRRSDERADRDNPECEGAREGNQSRRPCNHLLAR